MPSSLPLPTIQELVKAYHDAVRATRDETADAESGSVYDFIAGPSAILWSQEAQRDSDLFKAIQFNSAQGGDLTNLGETRFQILRFLDGQGRGLATFARPTAGFGADTIWAGTRITLQPPGGGAQPVAYYATTRTDVLAGTTGITVPIASELTGAGVAADSIAQGTRPVLQDPLGDSTWRVAQLRCADGTTFEQASDYRARVRETRKNNRVGYDAEIVTACQAAGAVNVALFRSDFGGAALDYGINACYVGDAGYSATPALVRKVTVALESVRVAGAEMPVGPMVATPLAFAADIYLRDDPSNFDLVSLSIAASAVLTGYFRGTAAGYSYRRDGLGGAVARVSNAVQSVSFTAPAQDGSVLNGQGQFPASLARYTLAPAAIQFAFHGPQ